MTTHRTSIYALLFAALVSISSFDTALAASPSASSGHFVWTMEGETAFVPRISGGGMRAVVETTEVDGAIFKEVVGLAHEDVVVELDLAVVPGSVAEWINESWSRKHVGHSGTWVAMDDLGNAREARDFFDAHITELRFPRLDADATEPAPLELRMSAEAIEDAPAPRLSATEPTAKQKGWVPSNYRFELGSLPCNAVIKVDELVIKQSVREGEAPVQISNLELRLPAADAGPWVYWFQSFVIDGQSTDADELNGSITFLSPDHESELGRIELQQVGIVALALDEEASQAAGFDVMKVELYLETVQIALGNAR